MVVGLSGYYGFQNAGDEALLEAIIQQLHARGHKPLVFSGSPKDHIARYSVKAVRRSHPLEVWRALGEIDLLISGGGTLLQDKTSAASLLYYLGIVSLAKRRGKRVHVFNQSLGPLSRRGERWVKRTLKGTSIFLRDKPSLEYATRLGLEAELGADCAMVLTPPPVEREESMVVLVPREGTEAANQTLRRVGERLRSSGHEVVVLGMQPGYDDEAIETFQGFTTEMAWDPRRVSYLLAQAGYVVSVRLHGCILAAAAGTPYAGISYDPKVAGFCADSGAAHQEAPGTPEFFVQAVEQRIQPDWDAISTMRERARHTFDRVLSRVVTPVKR
jgi:polysaccharide pyruvyl transferase CsaB